MSQQFNLMLEGFLQSCWNPEEVGSNTIEGMPHSNRVGELVSTSEDKETKSNQKMCPRFRVGLPTSEDSVNKTAPRCAQLLAF